MAESSLVKEETVHASCVVWNNKGLLIRGSSGSGKSTLSRMILYEAETLNQSAFLVSDDRTLITSERGKIFAQSVPPLQGLMEVRGYGIVQVPFQEKCSIDLVIDLVENREIPRYAYPEDNLAEILGLSCQRLFVPLDVGAISAIVICLKQLQISA